MVKCSIIGLEDSRVPKVTICAFWFLSVTGQRGSVKSEVACSFAGGRIVALIKIQSHPREITGRGGAKWCDFVKKTEGAQNGVSSQPLRATHSDSAHMTAWRAANLESSIYPQNRPARKPVSPALPSGLLKSKTQRWRCAESVCSESGQSRDEPSTLRYRQDQLYPARSE